MQTCPVGKIGELQTKCGGSECAWWDAEKSRCVEHKKANALQRIAEELNGIEGALDLLVARRS